MAEHSLLLFALSTCIHCKHAKEFLNSHNVNYDLVHVDLLTGKERFSVVDEIAQYNPSVSFPTLVVDGGKQVIIGFKVDKYEGLVDD